MSGGNRKPLAAAMLAAVLVLTATQGAHALVLCKRKSGALLLRDACRKKETAVDAAAVGTVGPPGAPAPAMRVLDANGRQVGDVTDTGNSVVFAVGGFSIQVTVRSDGFTQQVSFFHTSVDCSGDRFVGLFDPARLVRFAGVLGTTAFFASDPTQELTFASTEYQRIGMDCAGEGGTLLPNGFCCAPTSTKVQAAPPTTLDLSGFVPPFHVELAP